MDKKYSVLTLVNGDKYYFITEDVVRGSISSVYNVLLFDKESGEVSGSAYLTVNREQVVSEMGPIKEK